MVATDATRHAPVRVFGPFRLAVADRKLTVGAREIRIGSREFDILEALTETPNKVVSHRKLLDRVWPGLQTTESLLRVHITGLRKRSLRKTPKTTW